MSVGRLVYLVWVFICCVFGSSLLASGSAHTRMIYYLVNEELYTSGDFSIHRFMDDVRVDTASQARLFVVDENQDTADIRAILQNGYENEGLWGAFLIGATPYGYVEINGTPYRHLSDHPLRTFDCPYQGPDENVVWLAESNFSLLPACWPDIWLSRIYPSLSGADGIQQVLAYLDKNHLLRNDPTHFSPSMWYMDSIGIGQQGRTLEDMQLMFSDLLASHPLYAMQDLTIGFDTDAVGQAALFGQALGNNHETVKINIHGTPSLIQFTGISNTETFSASQLSGMVTNVKLVDLDSCSTGKFDEPAYLAGEMLFSGDTLLVIANPAVTAYTDTALANDINRGYAGLGLGFSFADLYVNTFSGSPPHFFGDPTLFFREKVLTGAPSLTMDGQAPAGPIEYNLDMGKVLRDESRSESIVLFNAGPADLMVQTRRITSYASYNHANKASGFVFTITDPYHFAFDFSETIPPATSLAFTFKFDPSANTKYNGPADYVGIFTMMTNDPRVGAIKITVKGKHIFNTGDFNGDGNIDGADLAVLVDEFSRVDCTDTATCPTNMDGDMDVDTEDLKLFGEVFGENNLS